MNYVPDLPEEDWARVRVFVLAIVADVRQVVPYALASLLNAVAHHVDWTANVAGYPMTRETLFRRDLIGLAVAMMPTSSPSTKGRRRSLLLRVGEALGVIPTEAVLHPLSAATPTTPYTDEEIERLETWAYIQRTEEKSCSARALVALGLGAGLPTRDIGAVRAVDVYDGGRVVGVSGRVVPVRQRWVEELHELSSTATDQNSPLFEPHVARSRNFITLFVARTIGAGVRPSTQRMRSTWLVAHLAEGTPMQDLLSAAGLESMDALVRYQRFLPPPSSTALSGTRR